MAPARNVALMPYEDSSNTANAMPQEAMRMMSPDNVMPIMSMAGIGIRLGGGCVRFVQSPGAVLRGHTGRLAIQKNNEPTAASAAMMVKPAR
jgi:hypothetical protein